MASNIGVARSILNHKGRKYFIVNINKQQGETNYIIYKDNIYKHKLIDTEIDEYWFKDNRRGYRVKDCW